MDYGLIACNKYFMKERDNTICRGISYTTFKSIEIDKLKHCEKRYLDTYGDNETNRKRLYSLYYSSVSNFRPSEAIRLYEIAKSKVVLDPCSGWGGRCFGAMSYSADYIGFDTNINLKECYKDLIKEYNIHNKNIIINFEDSSKIDYSNYVYDTVLTSPPYYKRELYNNMPNYNTPREFKNNFLKPMICNVYKHLQPGGFLFINLPDKYYKLLIEYIGRECNAKYEYRKTKRKLCMYIEYIYCWIKPSIK